MTDYNKIPKRELIAMYKKLQAENTRLAANRSDGNEHYETQLRGLGVELVNCKNDLETWNRIANERLKIINDLRFDNDKLKQQAELLKSQVESLWKDCEYHETSSKSFESMVKKLTNDIDMRKQQVAVLKEIILTAMK